MACYRKLRGVNLPYARQGYIRFTCLNSEYAAPEAREKIERLCHEAGGEYADALRAVMCTTRSIASIALQYHVSESTLYRIRKQFYEMWGK